jgi:enterochelin esterase-like enzyme
MFGLDPRYRVIQVAGIVLAISIPMSPTVRAQAPGQPAPATAPRRAPIVSPQVNADRTLTLRFRAPNAQQVDVIGEIDGKDHPMMKGADGVWSATIGPLAPDVYNYQYRVDGIIAMDPSNPAVKLGFGAFPPANLVEIPDTGLTFDDARPVPHGTVRMETYQSKSIGAPRVLWVYTPPGYEQGRDRLPVFYLLHGSGNIDSSWILTGRENYILDNLLAEGKAKPMIVVNMLGYARQGVNLGPDKQSDLAAISGPPGMAPRSEDSPFAKDLLDDVIPYVEGHFRTITDADHRALGGLSMGGGQTVAIGFTHPDVFHSLVVMSAGSMNAAEAYPGFFADPAATNKKIKLLWVGVGTGDTLVGPSAKALDATLTEKNIKHNFWTMDGRHEWVVWRHSLYEVAPKMFR